MHHYNYIVILDIIFFQICDMNNDCVDNSDEQACVLKGGDCSFEQEVWTDQTGSTIGCQYIQSANDNADWKLVSGGMY